MARIRTIKPSFWTSLTVAELPIAVRLTFVGLWNYADDEGRGIDDARLIKAAVWPLDDKVTARVVETYLAELARGGLIVRYGLNGRRYFQVLGWEEHQRIDRPKPSEYPAPDAGTLAEASTKPRRTVADSSLLEGKGREGKGLEREGSRQREDSSKPRQRNALFDALAEATGSDADGMTASEAKTCAVALAEIRKATPDVTPDEIRRRAANYPAHFREASLTPSALKVHWGKCARGRDAANEGERAARIADAKRLAESTRGTT